MIEQSLQVEDQKFTSLGDSARSAEVINKVYEALSEWEDFIKTDLQRDLSKQTIPGDRE